ncbi:peptidoglycan editing factor PgeF [Polyangium sp. y55x31]|uniref:peptidoglycan editing factor PgeF n=1 Tax=Polyangium sp. y55x31 TaxID=3042688 RepID=UPI0024831FBA|nr:peptidoglycan editing factor PgeF [Polyangium sp. y55x31]MDI1479883.1 peptidoglycan editing factor PgeF [Polyangium sp. y55x31]
MKSPNGEQASQRTTPSRDSGNPPVEDLAAPPPGPPLASAPSPVFSALLDAEGFRHAFFTRSGGVSSPPWDSLNVAAAATGDDPSAVQENIRRCAEALGVPLSRLYILSQVHGTDAHILDGTEDREEVVKRLGDITASRTPGVACGVRSADCVPVLLADRQSGAVVAVHSGWRGTVANAAAAGVAVLRTLAPSPSIVAAVGPHIEPCCFEVGDDVAASLASASDAGDDVVDRSRERAHVDLRRIVRAQLTAAGVEPARIDDVRGCTVCDHERYFSYRRDAAKSGRLLSAIVARA